jgi:hypothetical protein
MYIVCHYDQESPRKNIRNGDLDDAGVQYLARPRPVASQPGHMHVRLEPPWDGLMPSATSAWGRSRSRRFLQISGGLLGGKDRYDGDDVRLLPPRWRPYPSALTHPVPPSTPQPRPWSSTPTTTPCSEDVRGARRAREEANGFYRTKRWRSVSLPFYSVILGIHGVDWTDLRETCVRVVRRQNIAS